MRANTAVTVYTPDMGSSLNGRFQHHPDCGNLCFNLPAAVKLGQYRAGRSVFYGPHAFRLFHVVFMRSTCLCCMTLSALLACHIALASPPQQSSSAPTCTAKPVHHDIGGIDMVSVTSAYMKSDGRLLFTDSRGASWKDVTPESPNAPDSSYISSSFLSPEQGYAVMGHEINSDTNPVEIVDVFSTSNNGNHWDKLAPLPLNDFESKGFGGQAYLSWTDPEHGWVEIRLISSSAFSTGSLFSTADGGKHWMRLGFTPIGDRITFLSSTVGFLQGGTINRDFYRTADGGKTWTEIKDFNSSHIPDHYTVSQTLPYFTSMKNGSISVTVTDENRHSNTSTYDTQDGGQSWKQVGGLVSEGGEAKVVVTGSDKRSLSLHVGASGLTIADASGGKQSGKLPSYAGSYISHASFFDRQNDMAVLVMSSCTGFKAGCGELDTLVNTSDGGVSYADVTAAIPTKPLN